MAKNNDDMNMDHGMGDMDHSKMDANKMNMDHDMKNMDQDMSHMDHSDMRMDHGDMDMSGMEMGGDMMMHGGQMMHMGNLKQKFWVSVVLAIPVLLLAPIMGLNVAVINFNAPVIKGIAILLFDTALYFYGGSPFLKGAWAEVKSKAPAMMTLITLGISVSYFYSIYAFIANNLMHTPTHVMDFSFELATLILIMLLGHWLEMNAVMGAGDAVEKNGSTLA